MAGSSWERIGAGWWLLVAGWEGYRPRLAGLSGCWLLLAAGGTPLI